MAIGDDLWTDRAFLRGNQYKTDTNLAARQSIYAYQHPRIDLPATVLDLATAASAATIVDVGCGNGAYLALLARRGFAGRVLGIDLSAGMLAVARERLGEAPNPPGLVNADATALPLRDRSADLVLAPHMLYHVPDPARALRELHRITRPGGQVVIVLNGTDHMGQLREVVAGVRGEAPDSIIERVTLDDGEALAKDLFPNVNRHDFVAELRIPGPEPIAGYVHSMSETRQHAEPDQVVAAVLSAFPRTVDGHYVITSHSGCLICTVG